MTERPIVRPKRAESKPGAVLPSGVMWPFVLLTSCFAWWGLANNMTDTLLAAFKRIQSMSDSQTSLIQIAFYGSYFCFALPAAVFIKKYSYKSGVLLGRISWFRSISLRAASRYLKLPVRSKYSGH